MNSRANLAADLKVVRNFARVRRSVAAITDAAQDVTAFRIFAEISQRLGTHKLQPRDLSLRSCTREQRVGIAERPSRRSVVRTLGEQEGNSIPDVW